MTLEIKIRQDIGVGVLRKALKFEKEGRVVRRLLGMICLLEGGSRREAEALACLSLNVFRIWLKRFNADGIEGLCSRKPTGRPVQLGARGLQRLEEWVIQGPPIQKGFARYRLVDFQSLLQKEQGVRYGLTTLWRHLQRLGFFLENRAPASSQIVCRGSGSF